MDPLDSHAGVDIPCQLKMMVAKSPHNAATDNQTAGIAWFPVT